MHVHKETDFDVYRPDRMRLYRSGAGPNAGPTRESHKACPCQVRIACIRQGNVPTAYCAVCHGTDGKGGGPAATALKVPPTDLTLLSKNNGGKYPALKVTGAIHGDSAFP